MCIFYNDTTYKILGFTFHGVDHSDYPNPPDGIVCAQYDPNGWNLRTVLDNHGTNFNTISIVECPGPLIINNAPHIGELKLNLTDRANAIDLNDFTDGE